MQNKKLFFVISRMDRGGAQKVFLNIVNHLAQERNDIYLILYQSKPGDAYQKRLHKNINLIVLNATAKFGFIKLTSVLKKHKPDVVFSTLNYINISVALSLLLSGVKAKLILREARPLAETASFIIFLQKLVYKRADYLWAITPDIKQEVLKAFKFKEQRVILAPNPLDPLTLEHQPEDFKVKDVVNITYVGRLIGRKNPSYVIEVLSRVTSKNWKLQFVGAGDLEKELVVLTKEKNLTDKIEFVGFAENPYQYMRESDIFCIPSRYEGFPNVLTEALSCGNFAIASDTIGGGSRFIQQLIDTVEIVDYKDFDAVAKLIDYYIQHKDLLAQKKKESLQKAQQLQVENVVKQYFKTVLS